MNTPDSPNSPAAPRQEPPQEIPQWAKEAARQYIALPQDPTDEEKMHAECDVDDLAKCIARHAPPPAARVEQHELRELLGEIATTIEQRAVGHAIMYSDRITGFLPRIKAALSRPSSGEPTYENLTAKGWHDVAKEMSDGLEYYRGLLDKMAPYLGEKAFTCDDGSVSDSPLRAKFPELVLELVIENSNPKGEPASVGVGRLPTPHEVCQIDAAFAALQTIEKLCGHKSQGMPPMPWDRYIDFVVKQVEATIATTELALPPEKGDECGPINYNAGLRVKSAAAPACTDREKP